jgi:putative oxidoreductase
MIRPKIAVLCAFIVAGMHGWSSFGHLDNPYYFLNTVYDYQIVHRNIGVFVAAIIPVMQLVVTLSLLHHRLRLAGFVYGLLLFALFVTAQAVVMAKGLNIACGCFGPTEEPNPIGWRSISIPSLGILLCMVGCYCQRFAHKQTPGVPITNGPATH